MTDLTPQLEAAEKHLKRLLDLFRAQSQTITAEGSFALLLVSFAWKQEDHAAAILSLGHHRDVDLIARSMIEGLCQLKWAAREPEVRSERWQRFTWVQDWRLMRRKLHSGQPVAQEDQDRIELGIKEHGHFFKTRSARKKEESGDRGPDDPYVRHWSGKSVADLCDEVKGDLLYVWSYSHFSDWHHWSPAGVARAFKAGGRVIKYSVPGPADLLPAYTVAFQCLYETIELANSTLGMNLEDDLIEIRDSFLREAAPPTATVDTPFESNGDV